MARKAKKVVEAVEVVTMADVIDSGVLNMENEGGFVAMLNDNVEVSEVKKELDAIVDVVEKKVDDLMEVKVGRGKGERSYEVSNERVREIVAEAKGNKSKIIRELYKEFNLANAGIKKVMEGEGIEVRIQMVSNVMVEFKGRKIEE